MIKHSYTIDDARREMHECIREGYGFNYIRIFLHDLARGKDITWDDVGTLMRELIESGMECSYGTMGE